MSEDIEIPNQESGVTEAAIEAAKQRMNGTYTEPEPTESAKPTPPSEQGGVLPKEEAKTEERAAVGEKKEEQPIVEPKPLSWEELTEGKVKSREEFENVYQKANTEIKDPFAADIVKELNEFIANGGDAKQFFEYQATDYSKYSPADLIKAKLQHDNPELTPREVEAKFNKSFPQYDAEDDSDDAISANADFKIAQRDALNFFNEKKSKALTVPVKGEDKQAEAQKAWVEELKKDVESYFDKTNELEIPYGVRDLNNPDKVDAKTFVYKFDNKDELKALNQNPIKLLDLCTDEGGRLNQGKLTLVGEFAKNPQRFMTGIVNAAIADERQRWVEGIHNAGDSTSKSQERVLTTEQKAVEEAKRRQGIK
jgi:hypothetical protein